MLLPLPSPPKRLQGPGKQSTKPGRPALPTLAHMGIKGLSKLLSDTAPGCMKETNVQGLFGRKVAIDASMVIYQFLIQIRQGADQLTNDNGEVTSHITGMFYRTIKLLEAGVKPVRRNRGACAGGGGAVCECVCV